MDGFSAPTLPRPPPHARAASPPHPDALASRHCPPSLPADPFHSIHLPALLPAFLPFPIRWTSSLLPFCHYRGNSFNATHAATALCLSRPHINLDCLFMVHSICRKDSFASAVRRMSGVTAKARRTHVSTALCRLHILTPSNSQGSPHCSYEGRPMTSLEFLQHNGPWGSGEPV